MTEPIPPVPEGATELETWAQAHHLASYLDQPLGTLAKDPSAQHYSWEFAQNPSVTVREVLTTDEDDLSPDGFDYGWDSNHLRSVLRVFLRSRAAHRAKAEAEEADRVERWKRARKPGRLPKCSRCRH
jgi:hypothetical protein